jgi:hypothetical protein
MAHLRKHSRCAGGETKSASCGGEDNTDITQIDIYALECLRLIVSERSVSKGADKLGISQPSMRKVIGRLRRVIARSARVMHRAQLAGAQFAFHEVRGQPTEGIYSRSRRVSCSGGEQPICLSVT